jgi:hypothetical protein
MVKGSNDYYAITKEGGRFHEWTACVHSCGLLHEKEHADYCKKVAPDEYNKTSLDQRLVKEIEAYQKELLCLQNLLNGKAN